MKSLPLALALPTLVLASGTGGKILICSLQPVRRVKRRPKTIKMARHRPTKANWLKLLLHYWCRKGVRARIGNTYKIKFSDSNEESLRMQGDLRDGSKLWHFYLVVDFIQMRAQEAHKQRLWYWFRHKRVKYNELHFSVLRVTKKKILFVFTAFYT